MNTISIVNDIEILIEKLEESNNQLDRSRVSQLIKFMLDDWLESSKTSGNRETGSSRADPDIPISEITTSLFVISNYDVVEGKVFSNHLDYLQKSVKKLRSIPSSDT